MKYLFLLCTALFVLGAQPVHAQTPKSTYLYLEIDKNLPVKVKLNDRNIRNERKGYIIIPRMKNGKNTLEFNFANPNFKTHLFEVESVGKRSMGLKLMRVSNNKFVLQDVVNRRIISDINTLKSSPILASKKINKPANPTSEKAIAKKDKVERGVVKVYEAETTTPPPAPVKKKTIRKVNKQANVQKESEPTKVLAMYKYRQPMTDAKRRSRYKDYGKAKRAKRKAARTTKNKVNRTSTTDQEAKKLELEAQRKERLAREKQEELKAEKDRAAKKAEQLKREKAREAQVQAEKQRAAAERKKLKEEKRLKKEARRNAMLAREKAEEERIAKERAELKKEREEKLARKKRLALEKKKRKEADILETKEARLVKKKNSKKTKAAIGEKVINAEPISGQPATSKKRNYEEPNDMRPIRCTSTVRPEKAADWTLKLHKKFDDEARMNYIRRKMGKQCISTNNLGVLLGNMETQIGRYKMIRSVYDQIEDPSNIDRLYKYFKSTSYISKLKELKPNSY